ncbi:MAG: methyltransferase domain-containing protein [Candidatus Dadabacteria bacterium]|nr:MAG: methyltransferase domain-containing protein [Candidatus Dadabacteria bacterium]
MSVSLPALPAGLSLDLQQPPDLPELCFWLLDPDSAARPVADPALFRSLLDAPPYWTILWPAGRVLARAILDREIDVTGKTVLDFGCGSGIVAIAAARAGAAHVVAADQDLEALTATGANARANGVRLDTQPDAFAGPERVDVCIVADVFYDPENLPLLSRLRSRCRTLIVADCRTDRLDGRPPDTIARSATWPDVDVSEQFRNVAIWKDPR